MAQDIKRETILQAAQKRFAHFGVSKTTMTEIADDVSMSKASLYYYFPDKLSLYGAVIQHIVETDETDPEVYAAEKDPVKAMLFYMDNRARFLLKNYNILEHLRNLSTTIPDELQAIFSLARNREQKIVHGIIDRGKAAKLLKVDDAKKITELLLDSLEGLRFSNRQHKTNFFPDKKQLETMFRREKELATIFFKGLTC
ncbi:TetR/AcrR family transcriptional regulator [Segetibacter sp. 3557_3]|nr:TetR/AcrR family transcriptional regulator [Segetibacter sp. 3557_3]